MPEENNLKKEASNCSAIKKELPKKVFRKKTWKDIIVRNTDISDGAAVMIFKDGSVYGTKDAVEYYKKHPENFYEVNKLIIK